MRALEIDAYLAAVAEQVRRAQESHYGIGADECGRLIRMLTAAVEALEDLNDGASSSEMVSLSSGRWVYETTNEALATLTALAEEVTR